MGGPCEARFAGCLIGQCVGDAVGFAVEGAPAEICRRHADAVLCRGRIPAESRGGYRFGQYSDDSQLARELLISYVARGRFDPADYAARIAALFAEKRVVGGGWAIAQAAARLAAGVPWEHAGTPAPNAGNGSAMRAGPIGLMFHDDAENLIAAADAQGRITHADPRCRAGAVAIAGAVALAIIDPPLRPAAFAGILAEWTVAVDAGTGEALHRLVGWLKLPPEQAVRRIAGAGHADLPVDGGGISPFVTASVLWSLYAFLRSPDDYVAAIHTAIAVGGDVDTTAAMTGAIAGARCGLGAVPDALAGRLTDRGDWERGALVELAEWAWRVKTGG